MAPNALGCVPGGFEDAVARGQCVLGQLAIGDIGEHALPAAGSELTPASRVDRVTHGAITTGVRLAPIHDAPPAFGAGGASGL